MVCHPMSGLGYIVGFGSVFSIVLLRLVIGTALPVRVERFCYVRFLFSIFPL